MICSGSNTHNDTNKSAHNSQIFKVRCRPRGGKGAIEVVRAQIPVSKQH